MWGPLTRENQAKYFHKNIAKVLYLAKRVKPDCLTVVSFLVIHVTKGDLDDLKNLVRLLRYIRLSPARDIRFCRGSRGMEVQVRIDAAYGVYMGGKAHTGSIITVGEGGPVHAKFSK